MSCSLEELAEPKLVQLQQEKKSAPPIEKLIGLPTLNKTFRLLQPDSTINLTPQPAAILNRARPTDKLLSKIFSNSTKSCGVASAMTNDESNPHSDSTPDHYYKKKIL